MRDWLREHDFKAVALAIMAGASLLLASLANFLRYNGYPYLRPEVGLVVLGLLALAVAMAFFYQAQRQWGRSFLEGLLAALFVDLNTDVVPLVIAVGILVAAITAWRRVSLLAPMTILGSVVLVTTVAGVAPRSPWIATAKASAPLPTAPTGKPAILHLIVDEHLGIEGFPPDPEAQQMKQEVKDFYLRSGFALYGGAYSQHMHTVNAVPSVLNYGHRLGQGSSRKGALVGSTDHLALLVRQGYELHVIASDFADLCTGAVFHSCLVYRSESLEPTLALPWTVTERAGLIASKFAALSELAKSIAFPWNITAFLVRRLGIHAHTLDFHNNTISSSVSALTIFDTLIERLSKAKPGQAFVAHILLPHYPYVVDSHCRYLPWRQWEARRSESSLDRRRAAYFDQIRCTNLKIAAALDAFSRSPAANNAVVIIHGDHGSRLTEVDPIVPNLGQFKDSDMIAVYSTLFAIRAPGLEPRYIAERFPLPQLLGGFAEAGFKSAPKVAPEKSPSVYLDDLSWKARRRVPLPSNWTKRVDRPAAAH